MEAEKKRLTLELDPDLRQRLEAAAALKGVSMSRYCLSAIDRELANDEANGAPGRGIDREAVERLAARRKELFGGKPLPGNGADLIREAREIREREKGEADDVSEQRPYSSDAEMFRELQRKYFGDRVLPGSSVDLIREAREIREAEMDGWS